MISDWLIEQLNRHQFEKPWKGLLEGQLYSFFGTGDLASRNLTEDQVREDILQEMSGRNLKEFEIIKKNIKRTERWGFNKRWFVGKFLILQRFSNFLSPTSCDRASSPLGVFRRHCLSISNSINSRSCETTETVSWCHWHWYRQIWYWIYGVSRLSFKNKISSTWTGGLSLEAVWWWCCKYLYRPLAVHIRNIGRRNQRRYWRISHTRSCRWWVFNRKDANLFWTI